jgi:hypothetical protein
MTAYIPFLFLLFAATLLLSSYYWTVARPVILKRIVYRLFERRDKLRKMAISKSIDLQSADYQELEEAICKTIDFSAIMTLGSFLWSSVKHSEEIDQIDTVESCCEETEAMRNSTVGDALSLMSLNSPFVFGVLALSAGVLWIFGRFNRMLIIKRAEVFVDSLPSSPHGMRLA